MRFPDALFTLVKPDYDCVLEVSEHPTAFPMTLSFATVPSQNIANFLDGFQDNHPGVHSMNRQAREIQDYMFEKSGISHRSDKQSSLYQFAVSNVYQCKAFGISFANHLRQEFGLSVRFVYWPGGGNQFEKIYSPVNNL